MDNIIDINKIKSKDWQIKLNSFGQVVEGLDDIDQCIKTIIKTRKGSVPLDPTFGCDAHKYVDAPLQVARPNIIREVIKSIQEWEKRIVISAVTVEIGEDIAQLVIKIEWTIAQTNITGTTEENYERAA